MELRFTLLTSRKEYVYIFRILFFSLYILGGSCIFYRGGQANFFLVFKSEIRKLRGSFRYRKSANFLGVPVSKSQIRKFLYLIRRSQKRKFYKIPQNLYNSITYYFLLREKVCICGLRKFLSP